jgi:hypothetical protein
MYKPGIDFVIINFYGIEYVSLLVDSIHKYTTNSEYTIYIINNGDNESVLSDYNKLVSMYKIDYRIVILKGETQDREVKPEDGAVHKCKIDGRMVSKASVVKTMAQQKAWAVGNRKYICSLDFDAIFLNNWTDEILPLLSDNAFVSYFRYDTNIVRDQFMVIKREIVDKYNLYPNLDYVDGSGNISYFCDQTKLKYKVLIDSHHTRELRKNHVLALSAGEQIHSPSGLPIFYHFARGGSRDSKFKSMWIKEVSKYLYK